MALELCEDLREAPRLFPIEAKITDNPETVADAIRDFLAINDASQVKAAKQNRASDFWRRQLEEHDIMVFVVSGPHYSIDLNEMRGLAIARAELPVIVIIGRDYSQGGKCYSLLHELAHIVLGESAISNGTGEEFRASAEELRVERFCDAVALATLMPRKMVLSFEAAKAAGERTWTDDQLRPIANAIGVSREALLIRFITLGRPTWSFYHSQRQRFKDEYIKAAEDKANAPKKEVKIKRSIMLMSWNGRGYTRLVLRSYYDQRITLNDVSSYLGAKVLICQVLVADSVSLLLLGLYSNHSPNLSGAGNRLERVISFSRMYCGHLTLILQVNVGARHAGTGCSVFGRAMQKEQRSKLLQTETPAVYNPAGAVDFRPCHGNLGHDYISDRHAGFSDSSR